MKLQLPKLEEIPKIYTQQQQPQNITVHAHYHIPQLNFDWWITEYDPKFKEFYGFVNLNDPIMAEWGRFSIKELQSLSTHTPFPVQMDTEFKPQTIKKLAEKYTYLQKIW